MIANNGHHYILLSLLEEEGSSHSAASASMLNICVLTQTFTIRTCSSSSSHFSYPSNPISDDAHMYVIIIHYYPPSFYFSSFSLSFSHHHHSVCLFVFVFVKRPKQNTHKPLYITHNLRLCTFNQSIYRQTNLTMHCD